MLQIHTYISTSIDGDIKHNLENRKKLEEKLGIVSENFTYIRGNHGENIYEIGKEKPEFYDGIISTKKDAPICAFAADCLGIFFYDEVAEVIGVVHAGREGTKKEIAKEMIQKFLEKGSNLEDIQVEFSPSISQENYEITREYTQGFHRETIKEISIEKVLLNVALENKLQLLDIGIPQKNILLSKIDTYTDKNYFSHRRGDTERFGNFIWMK